LRVVAGSAKGTKLASVPEGVRPLSDRAREGLFSSLGERVVDAEVLDLYAGTGAIGIEALSRGAAGARFVESSRAALEALRANLTKTRMLDRADVVASEVDRFLGAGPQGRRYGLVFLDPPYELGSPALDLALARLADGWLSEGFTVVLTRGRKSSNPVIPLHWVSARQLRYGDSLVTLFREVAWA
jgi:16S rRNA (guanine966-N2)-methyltransferase